MKAKKRVFVGLFVFLLLAGAFLIIYGGSYIRANKAINDFSKYIEKGNFNDLILTIYYVSPYIFTPFPLSVEDLIRYSEDKIVIEGSQLEQYIDLLNQVKSVSLKPVIKKTYMDARIYYVFETEKKGKLFDVTMFGLNDDSIFINGIEVKWEDIFYDIIVPFLPEDF